MTSRFHHRLAVTFRNRQYFGIFQCEFQYDVKTAHSRSTLGAPQGYTSKLLVILVGSPTLIQRY